MKPFGKRIQVKPEKDDTVIQTADQNLVEKAVVIASGPDCETLWEPGDIVYFTSFGVDSIDISGERHYFILETDAFILATERNGMD